MKIKKLNIIYVSNSSINDVEFYARLKILKSHFLDSKFYYQNAKSLSESKLAQEIKYGFVFFYITDIIHIARLEKLCLSLKENNCLLVIGGGVDIYINFVELLETFKYIDAVVCNPEFDKVLEQFKGKNIGNIRLAEIKGCAYRKQINNNSNNKIVNNENLPISTNIDNISSTELFLNGHIENEWYPIIVSLGCRNKCQYCGFQFLYPKESEVYSHNIKRKSVKAIVDEIEFLNSKGQKRFSFFCHQFLDINNGFPLYVNILSEELLKRNLNISFQFSAKPSLICQNINSIKKLKESGMVKINVGLDSGLTRFHKMYKTGSNINDCIDALRYLSENKIEFDTFFIFYDPYLSMDEFNENLIFINNIKIYYSHLHFPFSMYLDSRILNSTLYLKYGMPIINKLRLDQLLFEKSGFVSHPIAKFKDKKIMLIYSIYRALNDFFIKKIRHLFYDRDIVARYPTLNTLLLRLMEFIFNAVKENIFTEMKAYISESEKFLKDSLKPIIIEISTNHPQYANKELEKEILNK